MGLLCRAAHGLSPGRCPTPQSLMLGTHRARRLVMPPRVTRVFWYVVGPLAALALCALVASFWCSETKRGRSFVARRIEQLVTTHIPGRLEIGELTQLDGPHLAARNVRFYHPDG